MTKKSNCQICENKLAVVIEDKKYYCGKCYCIKYNIYDNRTSVQSDRIGLEET